MTPFKINNLAKFRLAFNATTAATAVAVIGVDVAQSYDPTGTIIFANILGLNP
jgi:hypothetical protein